MLRTIVIVGASLSGLHTAESLRRDGFAGKVVLVGAEDALPYDRPPLSKQFLRGEWDEKRILLRSEEELNALDLDLELGRRAVGLDIGARRVVLEDGRHLGYDALVIATGAETWRPVAWDLGGVFDLRTLEDARSLAGALADTDRLVVVGAGFIGCEVAASARHLGLQVELVEALPVPLARTFGPRLGAYCADLHRAHGVRLHAGVAVDEVVGHHGRVSSVRLANGETFTTDVVVVGLGVRPATAWLAGSGLDITDGVRCDENLAAAPGIYVAGDAARWQYRGEHVRVEHWTNAVEQATHVARHLLAGEHARASGFRSLPYFWSDQYDAKFQGLGLPSAGDHSEVLAGSFDSHRFVVGYRRGERLSGVVAANWPRMFGALRRQLAREPTWEEVLAQVELLAAS